MREDILEQVVADINASPAKISLQVDESTNQSNSSQLIAVVRYVKKKEIKENFLFCQSLKPTLQAKDVFDKKILCEAPNSLRQDWFDTH